MDQTQIPELSLSWVLLISNTAFGLKLDKMTFPLLKATTERLTTGKKRALGCMSLSAINISANNRYANFFVGFDFYQAFTVDYRTYNIDDMSYTDGEYFDGIVGFRLGWVIPIYKQAANKFYLD